MIKLGAVLHVTTAVTNWFSFYLYTHVENGYKGIIHVRISYTVNAACQRVEEIKIP